MSTSSPTSTRLWSATSPPIGRRLARATPRSTANSGCSRGPSPSHWRASRSRRHRGSRASRRARRGADSSSASSSRPSAGVSRTTRGVPCVHVRDGVAEARSPRPQVEERGLQGWTLPAGRRDHEDGRRPHLPFHDDAPTSPRRSSASSPASSSARTAWSSRTSSIMTAVASGRSGRAGGRRGDLQGSQAAFRTTSDARRAGTS